ncbi:MAG: hypothetical protein QXF17_04715 [Ignisphaera sp.]|uniref:FG-GAP repeat protein n=1 Tax=Ignisphaera aggregans TaxID=334771 RepID=A0A7J3I7T2_9CREN
MSLRHILYLHNVELPVFDPDSAYNLDFSDGLTYWILIKHSDLEPTVRYLDGRGIEIVGGRESKWSLVYKPLIRVHEEDYYIIEAYVRYRFYSNRFNPKKGIVDGFVVRVEALDRVLEPIELRIEKWMWGDNGETFYRTDWRCGYKPCISIGRFRCGDIALSGYSDWKRVFSFFKTPTGTRYLMLYITGQGNGTVSIGGVRVRNEPLKNVALEHRESPFKTLAIPRATVYRSLLLRNFAGRIMRIGDLDGDGIPEFVFVQNENVVTGEKYHHNIYRHISCVTAVNIDGSILWQIGRPDARNFPAQTELPIGVIDINGDGRDEVVLARNFKLIIIEGSSGKTIRSRDTPKAREGGGFVEGSETIFERVFGDHIVFADLRGLGRARDIVFKDRYNNMWTYTEDLDELWSYSGKLIHTPLIYDFDDDGRDEVFAGDALIDDNGRVLWRIDLYDHCDSAVAYRYNGRMYLAIANQDGGVYFIDVEKGEVIKEWHLGHAQIMSLANFDPTVSKPLIVAQTFWGGVNQFVFDLSGEMIFAAFNKVFGWVPVNWIGNGSELIAAPNGLYDLYGNIVVPFEYNMWSDSEWGPKVYVWNIVGDPRDEVIVWNEHRLIIYTQDDNPRDGVYIPRRRMYNQSLYGNFISE